jgi:GNAT superfamily N-acetyltransferase
MKLEWHPLTMERWHDFKRLFGERGACGGCWCMLWRLKRSQFERLKGEGNRRAMRAIVESGTVPGILAYAQEEPVAWCSVAPREDFQSLARSRILKKVDETPVWSISCLFIASRFRGRGLSVALAAAAVDYVSRRGGRMVEAYPVEPGRNKRQAPVFVWTGLASAFRKAGFRECARRSPTRPIMRFHIRGNS